jgi:hypothetical protein
MIKKKKCVYRDDYIDYLFIRSSLLRSYWWKVYLVVEEILNHKKIFKKIK